MKVALGAAAAITGASALLYLILRSRRKEPDLGKLDVPGSGFKNGIPSEGPASDTKVFSKEAKDTHKGLNGHIPRDNRENVTSDVVTPTHVGLQPEKGEQNETNPSDKETSSGNTLPSELTSVAVSKDSLCKESHAEIHSSSIVTENSRDTENQSQVTEKERTQLVKDEDIKDQDNTDGLTENINLKEKHDATSKELHEICEELQKSLETKAPEILLEKSNTLLSDKLESVPKCEPEVPSSVESTYTHECLFDNDNYCNDRDTQEDIVPVAKLVLESFDEQDVPKLSDGDSNDSGISSSTNLVSETVASTQCVQDDSSDDTAKVQKSESSFSRPQNDELCLAEEMPSLTLSSSTLQKLRNDTEVTNNVEVTEVATGSDDIPQESVLEKDDGIQQDISIVDPESPADNASVSPITKDDNDTEISIVNKVEDTINGFNSDCSQQNVDIKDGESHAVDNVPDCNDKQILNWAAEVQEEIAREKAEQQNKEQVSEENLPTNTENHLCTKNETNPVTSSTKETVKNNSKKTIKDAPEKSKRRRGGKQVVKNEVAKDSHVSNQVRNKENSQSIGADSATTDLDNYQISEPDSQNCDSQSLKSIDSGQGSIEVEPETVFNPSAFPVISQEQYLFYEFEIPQTLVGRLIGRKGAFVNKIKATTDATVIVHPHKDRRMKICSVEGTRHQVDGAIRMIREHFPEDKYPDVTLEQLTSRTPVQAPFQPTVNSQAMQIELTAGVVVEVRVSSIMSGGEMWVQQPLHPSFSALQRLHSCMNLNYGDGTNTPPLPQPIQEGTICVAQVNLQWMRCQVLSFTEEAVMAILLDVGGIISLPTANLRQIRYDYMTLPFQASQCLLHGIQPVDDDGWTDVSATVLEELVSGTILFSTVVAYTEDGVPLVNLYRRQQDQYVNLNEKMVHLGHAKWITPPTSS